MFLNSSREIYKRIFEMRCQNLVILTSDVNNISFNQSWGTKFIENLCMAFSIYKWSRVTAGYGNNVTRLHISNWNLGWHYTAFKKICVPNIHHRRGGGWSMFFTPPHLSDPICKIVWPIFRKKGRRRRKNFEVPFFKKIDVFRKI